MNRKIAILTLYGNNNFGNKLQNYAVQIIGEKYKFNVKTVLIRDRFIKRTLKKIICKKKNKIELEREKKFIKFNKDIIKYTKWSVPYNIYNSNILKEYEFLLYGSDQIWKYGNRGVSNLLIGKCGIKKQNVSISASFGVDNIPEKYKEKYISGLNNFKAISVRENAGKKIVEELTERTDVELLVDPTMLLTKSEWQKLSKKPKNMFEGKYILNYFLGKLSEERRDKINYLAKKNGWKIINILDKNDPFYISGPSEFIYLEEHAELICTDSFHSCVFGILMDTPFVVFEREDKTVSMNSRLETLLFKFKLEDRYYNGELNESYLICDYSHCEEILVKEREKADKFLRKALEIE